MQNLSSTQIAKHFRELYFGGSWTWSDLQSILKNVTWQQAIKKTEGFNTIAALVYHIHYFVKVGADFLEYGKLEGSDKLSFDHPPITSEENWNAFLEEVWKYGKRFSELTAKLSDSKLQETFSDKKYGIYFRNLMGTIEHGYYHLGQISILKRMV